MIFDPFTLLLHFHLGTSHGARLLSQGDQMYAIGIAIHYEIDQRDVTANKFALVNKDKVRKIFTSKTNYLPLDSSHSFELKGRS
jgi:hypothetical protein